MLNLVHITPESHDVSIDLMYAGVNNFTGQVIYEHALCFLHTEAEAALRKAIVAARARQRQNRRAPPLRQSTSGRSGQVFAACGMEVGCDALAWRAFGNREPPS